jgi:hypothetical protein
MRGQRVVQVLAAGLPGNKSRCSGNCTSMPCLKLPTAGMNTGRRVRPVYA